MPRPHPVRRRDGTIAWRVRFRLDGGGNPVSETFDDEDAAARPWTPRRWSPPAGRRPTVRRWRG